MILVDTSVWVAHLRYGDDTLVQQLQTGQVLAHPFVIGEISLGNLRKRSIILGALQNLPQAVVASDAEVLGFIEEHELAGKGVGYIDAHLLASARLTPDTALWTRDTRLATAAKRLGVAFS
jgi:predicted nucleic acid-binding protein